MAVELRDPVFVLAAPRSFSSVVCGMLGQHPQLHGLPETHLFADEVLERWVQRSLQQNYPMAHGLLRAVAQLCFGEQTESSVRLAAAWLKRRSSSTSGIVFEELALRAAPAALVDKSPSLVYNQESMRRAYEFFPQARFIHLTRHPRGHAHSVLKYVDKMARWAREGRVQYGTVPDWLRELARFPQSSFDGEADPDASGDDPQRGWYVLNRNIVTFLTSVPRHQWMTIRGEDLLRDPEHNLQKIAGWLGLRTDAEAVDEMKHPERSPYAKFGPPSARCGNDIFFLQDPVLRQGRADSQTLEGPVKWLSDVKGFSPEVKELAQKLGYQ